MSASVMSLTWMATGQGGTVIQIQGGMGLISRLTALGIRPGKKIMKVSSMVMRGPVIIEMDKTQYAIGFGMANRVMVKLEETRK